MRAWTKQLRTAELRAELEHVLGLARELGAERCEAMFGFAWGNDYYPGSEWPFVDLTFDRLPGEIEWASALGWGGFGENDLVLRFPPLDGEVTFCHEADIHLDALARTGFAGMLLERWKAGGRLHHVDPDAGPQPG